ncbi:MAG: hypothetical protein IT366_19965 [Candidatus Hydrogenedentes bacterium]|nr:hypothetical protein [Candidatus Hydrogenedentota bacterium]
MAMVEEPEGQPFSLRDEETICFIPDDLRRIVLRLLRESSPASTISAAKDLYDRAEREDIYFTASSMYDFLWKKVPAEARRKLYPIVGDFFLTALERNLAIIGPNNMISRFRELMECYTGAGDKQRILEGPLYCADLFLLKTSQLVLGARDEKIDSGPEEAQGSDADFLSDERFTVEQQIGHSLQLAKDALLDAQKTFAKLGREESGLDARYLKFLRATMERLSLSWQNWQEMHARKDIASISVEKYFKEGISRAEKVNSLVLAALLLEQVGEEYENKMNREFLNHRFSARPADHPKRGCTFDAAEIYRDQGIAERDHGAYVLSERRFTKSISLFGQLHDRTSIAQTLVERARLYVLRGTDAWKAHRDLHLAAQNIAAVQRRLPPNAPMPNVPAAEVLQFYEGKGLVREAEVYREQEALLAELH